MRLGDDPRESHSIQGLICKHWLIAEVHYICVMSNLEISLLTSAAQHQQKMVRMFCMKMYRLQFFVLGDMKL